MDKIIIKTDSNLLLHEISALKTEDIHTEIRFQKSADAFPYELIVLITGTAINFVDVVLRVLELIKKHNDRSPNKTETNIYTSEGNVEIEKLVILHQNTININVHTQDERDT